MPTLRMIPLRISVKYVPHEKLHHGQWLLSIKRPGWYYFNPGRTRATVTEKNFYKTVDPPLKKLILALHQQGIQTTPSCSGHCKSATYFKKIHRKLLTDE